MPGLVNGTETFTDSSDWPVSRKSGHPSHSVIRTLNFTRCELIVKENQESSAFNLDSASSNTAVACKPAAASGGGKNRSLTATYPLRTLDDPPPGLPQWFNGFRTTSLVRAKPPAQPGPRTSGTIRMTGHLGLYIKPRKVNQNAWIHSHRVATPSCLIRHVSHQRFRSIP